MRKTIYLGAVGQLARKCEYCHGSGVVETAWNEEGEATKSLECGECDGKGGHVTDEGQAILDFVESYGRGR